MYAQISIDHAPGDAIGFLQKATGMPDTPSSVLESTFPGQAELLATGNVLYSAANASWVVFSSVALSNQLQLVVSSKHGNVKQASEDIWRAYRTSAATLSPRLSRLEILDPTATAPIAVGEVGVGAFLRRLDFSLALWPGMVSTVAIGVGVLSGFVDEGAVPEVWLAGAPAIVVSLIAVVLLLREIRRGGVTWQG
jgi:hypothetical protein